jgi:hypothetical protein
MPHKKRKTQSGAAARDSVIREIAKPRMARSARIAEQKLNSARIPQRPSVSMPGTVDKIIPPPHPRQPEKAQIAVDGAHRPHQNLRIDNDLLDENGNDVKLKKGARVELTVTSESEY